MVASRPERDPWVEQLERARRETNAALEGADWAGMVDPRTGWRVQDVVGHIAAWEVEMNRSLRAHAGGGEYTIQHIQSWMDRWNAEQIEMRKTWGVDQVRAEFDAARGEFIAFLRALPDERLVEPILTPWDVRGSLRYAIEVMLAHEAEHRRAIQRALAAD